MHKIIAMIDHTLLKPEATQGQIEQLCMQAQQNGFASVCVQPVYVRFAAGFMSGSGIPVATVVGFPHGSSCTAVKMAEATNAIEQGAEEIDMVIHVGALKDGHFAQVQQEIAAVVAAAQGHCVKVIIECCLLTDQEKIIACKLAMEAGAHFVKTSTGYSTGGAIAADVRLMRQVVGASMGVKASGGIRTMADAAAMVEAGASRLGTASGLSILNEIERMGEYI